VACLYNRAVRVLLLNLYFPPDTSATAKMAQIVANALAERHDVTVLCGRPSYDPLERRPWKLWETERVGRTRVIRVGSTDYPRFAMKRRVMNYLSYVLFAVPRALLLRCDVVLAMTDPPFEGIVGAFLAALKRKPFVYNVRDLYPDMAVAGSIVEPGLLSRVWERLHRWALRRATKVIALGEDMKARLVRKGVSPERIAVVRDGADISSADLAPPAVDGDVVRTIRANFRFVLLHAGNLGFYGAWQTMIAGAQELAAEGVGLVFVGEGAQRPALESAAKNIRNVQFLDFFPSSKIPSVMAAADAHVITVKRGLEGVVVPSKMYSILAAGKPIVALASADTDVTALGCEQGFSIAAEPDSSSQFAAAVRELLRDPQRLGNMSEAARAAARGYDRVAELQKFVRVLEEAGGT
jgi:colanic acid biosynthesis glycosyl transferase WcaI